jgi:phage-related protein
LILSDDETKCYKAMIADDIPFRRQRTSSGKRFDELSVRFECHPFGYEATPTILTKTAPFSLSRIGTIEAYPLIQLTATGDIALTIGDKTLAITGVPGSCIIDVPGGLIYSGSTNLSGNASTDDWPLTIPAGTGSVPVSWTGNVTQMIIQPNWGWL